MQNINKTIQRYLGDSPSNTTLHFFITYIKVLNNNNFFSNKSKGYEAIHNALLGKSNDEISKELGVSAERVRQLVDRNMNLVISSIIKIEKTFIELSETKNKLIELHENHLKLQKYCVEILKETKDPDELDKNFPNGNSPLYDTKIEDVRSELSVRCYNSLKRAAFKTLGEITEFDEDGLLKFNGFGKKLIVEIKTALLKRELHLKA